MEYKTKQVGEVEIILGKSKAIIRQGLFCEQCEVGISECFKCGGIFGVNDEILCDDDGHHWHIGCEK